MPSIFNQRSEGDRNGEPGTPSAALVISDSMDANNQRLPFVKSCPVWKIIESMEIFQKTPQKPHFSPLANCNEDVREGLAIAHMVNFSGMMDRISKIRLSDPRSNIDRSLETLAELKLHGFDVREAEVLLKGLLSKKNRMDELQLEYKNVETQIRKSNGEKVECEVEMNEIRLKMKELAEKLAVVTTMNEMKKQEICTLQSQLEAIRKNINSFQLNDGCT